MIKKEFIDSLRYIVKNNKEDGLSKWLFGYKDFEEYNITCEYEKFLVNNLLSLQRKIIDNKQPLLVSEVEQTNIGNVIDKLVYEPIMLLNIKDVVFDEEEEAKLLMLILYDILHYVKETTLNIEFLSCDKNVRNLTNYDKNDNIRNFIKKDKKFDKLIVIVKLHSKIEELANSIKIEI